jgi:hypothetical protein
MTAIMLVPISVSCPYCGEVFDTAADTSTGDQEYIEDCQVCCRPIRFYVRSEPGSETPDVEVGRDDD